METFLPPLKCSNLAIRFRDNQTQPVREKQPERVYVMNSFNSTNHIGDNEQTEVDPSARTTSYMVTGDVSG